MNRNQVRRGQRPGQLVLGNFIFLCIFYYGERNRHALISASGIDNHRHGTATHSGAGAGRRGMEAISVVTVASVLGGIIGAVCPILCAPALGKIAKQMARICLVPNSVLVPIIVALASIGTYALSNSMYEVVILLFALVPVYRGLKVKKAQ